MTRNGSCASVARAGIADRLSANRSSRAMAAAAVIDLCRAAPVDLEKPQ
jgi:hypothetical protein